MGAEEKNAGVAVENVLGAVAVVDVPIGDQDALGVVDLLGVAGGDGYIIKYAEAHAARGGGVVTGRADGGESVAHAVSENGVDGGQAGAGGHQGDVEGVDAERGVAGAEQPGLARHVMPDHLDISARVDQVQVLVARGAGLDGRQGLEQPRVGQGVVQRDVARGALRMAVAGIVALEEQVENESGR